jgi:thiol-disulfide isomerase/thioredoxin
VTRLQTAAIVALGVLVFPERHADAQVTIDPVSPRWGESITITAEPNPADAANQTFTRSDRLYVVLGTFQKGVSTPFRPWAPMSWDGRRFVGTITLPDGCEAGYVWLATAERNFAFATNSRSFTCRTREGAFPPGALISGLTWGGRDAANWKADVQTDLAVLRPMADHGWAYAILWLFRLSHESSIFTKEERLREVERVEHEETNRTPGLLTSLAYGYVAAGATAKAFERLKELCDRFPESELTPSLGLYRGYAAASSEPEFRPELDRLVEQVAVRAPANKGLRNLFTMVSTTPRLVPPQTLREIATRWMRDDPAIMHPYYLLATALAGPSASPEQQAEAEATVNRAIDLSLRARPFETTEYRLYQRAYELRSRLRAARGDLAGALADARMAQAVAVDKVGADAMGAEADLWRRLGFGNRAEDLAIEAYRLGSLTVEALLKDMYVARTGGDAGFRDYLIARLRERGVSSTPAFRPAPSFSTTMIDGTRIDASIFQNRITVLDFWFFNCPPCRVERPKLNDLVAEFAPQVRFVGFSIDRPGPLKTYLAANPFKFEVVAESDEIVRAFGVRGFPTYMIVDRAGKIVWASGNDDDRVERLRAMIVRVLASQSAKPD